MERKNVTFLTHAAMIAAIYVVLTVVFQPFSFGEVQVRISEMLTLLPIFTPAAIPGLFVGCLIGNVLGGAVIRGYHLRKHRNADRSSIYVEAAQLQAFYCGTSTDHREYLHRAVCAPLCIRRGTSDPDYDGDGRSRRGDFL